MRDRHGHKGASLQGRAFRKRSGGLKLLRDENRHSAASYQTCCYQWSKAGESRQSLHMMVERRKVDPKICHCTSRQWHFGRNDGSDDKNEMTERVSNKQKRLQMLSV